MKTTRLNQNTILMVIIIEMKYVKSFWVVEVFRKSEAVSRECSVQDHSESNNGTIRYVRCVCHCMNCKQKSSITICVPNICCCCVLCCFPSSFVLVCRSWFTTEYENTWPRTYAI